MGVNTLALLRTNLKLFNGTQEAGAGQGNRSHSCEKAAGIEDIIVGRSWVRISGAGMNFFHP